MSEEEGYDPLEVTPPISSYIEDTPLGLGVKVDSW